MKESTSATPQILSRRELFIDAGIVMVSAVAGIGLRNGVSLLSFLRLICKYLLLHLQIHFEADLLFLLNHIVEGKPYDVKYDFDHDNNVGVLDLLAILNFIIN